MQAVIEIPISPDMVELLPHELEHVIEQLEGETSSRWRPPAPTWSAKSIRASSRPRGAQAASRAVIRELFGGTDPALSTAAKRVAHALRLVRPAAAPPRSGAGLMRR
jgi:hypothetical protein